MPDVHAIYTEEAYKDFTVQETAPPKIVSILFVAKLSKLAKYLP